MYKIGLKHQYEHDKFNFGYFFMIQPQALIRATDINPKTSNIFFYQQRTNLIKVGHLRNVPNLIHKRIS